MTSACRPLTAWRHLAALLCAAALFAPGPAGAETCTTCASLVVRPRPPLLPGRGRAGRGGGRRPRRGRPRRTSWSRTTPRAPAITVLLGAPAGTARRDVRRAPAPRGVATADFDFDGRPTSWRRSARRLGIRSGLPGPRRRQPDLDPERLAERRATTWPPWWWATSTATARPTWRWRARARTRSSSSSGDGAGGLRQRPIATPVGTAPRGARRRLLRRGRRSWTWPSPARQAARVWVLLGNGNGAFTARLEPPVGDETPGASPPATSSANGDARPRDREPRRRTRVSILKGNGDGTSSPPPVIARTRGRPTRPGWPSLQVGGTTRPDIVVSTAENHTVNLLLDDGAGRRSACRRQPLRALEPPGRRPRGRGRGRPPRRGGPLPDSDAVVVLLTRPPSFRRGAAGRGRGRSRSAPSPRTSTGTATSTWPWRTRLATPCRCSPTRWLGHLPALSAPLSWPPERRRPPWWPPISTATASSTSRPPTSGAGRGVGAPRPRRRHVRAAAWPSPPARSRTTSRRPTWTGTERSTCWCATDGPGRHGDPAAEHQRRSARSPSPIRSRPRRRLRRRGRSPPRSSWPTSIGDGRLDFAVANDALAGRQPHRPLRGRHGASSGPATPSPCGVGDNPLSVTGRRLRRRRGHRPGGEPSSPAARCPSSRATGRAFATLPIPDPAPRTSPLRRGRRHQPRREGRPGGGRHGPQGAPGQGLAGPADPSRTGEDFVAGLLAGLRGRGGLEPRRLARRRRRERRVERRVDPAEHRLPGPTARGDAAARRLRDRPRALSCCRPQVEARDDGGNWPCPAGTVTPAIVAGHRERRGATLTGRALHAPLPAVPSSGVASFNGLLDSLTIDKAGRRYRLQFCSAGPSARGEPQLHARARSSRSSAPRRSAPPRRRTPRTRRRAATTSTSGP